MATKKELEERIAALEAQVAMLLARPTYPVIGPVLPQPSLPGWPPQIWCGSGQVVASDRTFTINGVAA